MNSPISQARAANNLMKAIMDGDEEIDEVVDMPLVRDYFKRDRLAELLGMEIVELGPGRATVRMTVQQRHLNGLDSVHGGALFSLADFTFAVAANTHGTCSVALNASISFTKAIREGETLTAIAKELTLHPKIATYSVEIYDDEGDIAAHFQGTVYRKKMTLEEAVNKPSA